MRREARTGNHESAAALAGFNRVADAARIPFSAAAIRVVSTDRRAAHRVVAVGFRVLFDATACAAIAATWRGTAVDAREGSAGFIPRNRAASFVDRADARTAGFVIASSIGVRFEAITKARARPAWAGHAMESSARYAVHIPARSAANGIEPTNDVAASGIIATRSGMANAALAASRATGDGVTNALRDIDAVRVPAQLAAVRLNLTDRSAAEFIGASWLWMDEVWIASVGAVGRTIAEIGCVRRAGFIPRP